MSPVAPAIRQRLRLWRTRSCGRLTRSGCITPKSPNVLRGMISRRWRALWAICTKRSGCGRTRKGECAAAARALPRSPRAPSERPSAHRSVCPPLKGRVAGPLNMRVTLNGTLGSGKSTVGKELARRLGVHYISTGQIFRELGHISNPDVLQTNLEAESNSALDDAVDNKVRELNKTVADFVIDSRMAWHFIDDALHVFLSVTPEVAAQRVMRDRTRLNEQYASMEAALEDRKSTCLNSSHPSISYAV